MLDDTPWPRDLNPMASGNPGAIQPGLGSADERALILCSIRIDDDVLRGSLTRLARVLRRAVASLRI